MINPLKLSCLVSYLYILLATTQNAVLAGPAGAAASVGLKALDYRYFVAGGVCAATSHGLTTPIDVVKTKMQAQPEVSSWLHKYCIFECIYNYIYINNKYMYKK